MTLPNLDPARGPAALYADISDYVAKADALVQAQGSVELQGLDTAVQALCNGIMALPPDEAKQYASKLHALMEAIEAMQTNMVQLQAKIATAMKSLTTQKRAASAYLNTPSGEKAED